MAELLLIRGLFLLFLISLVELLLGRVLGSVCEAQLPLCVEEEFTQMQNLVYVVNIGCIRLIVIWLILKLTLYALGVCSFFCLFLKLYFSKVILDNRLIF